MDLDKFVSDLKQLQKERDDLAKVINTLENKITKANNERDLIAKSLLETQKKYENMTTQIIRVIEETNKSKDRSKDD